MRFFDRFMRKPVVEHQQPRPLQPAQPQSGAPAPAATPVHRPLMPEGIGEYRFELGDFLARITGHVLAPGEHNPRTELRFAISEISRRIAAGRPEIDLTEIYRRLPRIFSREISEADGLHVFLPWRKIVRHLAAVPSSRRTA